jgi:hypothetical protein
VITHNLPWQNAWKTPGTTSSATTTRPIHDQAVLDAVHDRVHKGICSSLPRASAVAAASAFGGAQRSRPQRNRLPSKAITISEASKEANTQEPTG